MGSMTTGQALTVFGIVGGIAGGVGQIILSKKLGESKVNAGSVVLASVVVATATIFGVLLIQKIEEQNLRKKSRY